LHRPAARLAGVVSTASRAQQGAVEEDTAMTVETMLLVVHIAAGAVLLVLGPLNMFIPKRRGPHTRIGETYHWLYVAVAGSALTLALLNWAESWFFVPITLFSYAFALTGYLAVKLRPRGWLIPHVIGQTGSYISLVSAFVTVNWESFGGAADSTLPFYLPSLIGFPIVAWLVVQVR
jgi:uncharacterized membrane protein